ncbi:DUF998 domain-containing protein [Enterococcus sp. 2201sp1_2201st1_B8_2201SCRN_220225]|uniref:DUF998 domain-containing protein n=1 Tax=unclassified Enterococcus TaxID=2608891 RepID=UPI0034A32037
MGLINRYGFLILIVAVISELTLPFVLGHFVTGYSQIEMLISSLGETGAKTRTAFRIWEIVNGCLFLLAAPAFYQRFEPTSTKLALVLAACLVLFGLGDCIITGIVSRAKDASEVGFSSLLHNYASGAGFVALLLGTFLLIGLFYLEGNSPMVVTLILVFVLSGIFMVLFAMPKIPLLNAFQVSHRGLWQRLNLFFLYLPFVLVSLKSLGIFKG